MPFDKSTYMRQYMREYRKLVKQRRARKSHQDGIVEGVERSCRFLRDEIGEKSISGHYAAHLLYKTLGVISNQK